MKQYKTSAIMRAIVADASLPGAQRDAASRVLTALASCKYATWADLYYHWERTLAKAAGLPWASARSEVLDALVKLAKRYRIQPTEDA